MPIASGIRIVLAHGSTKASIGSSLLYAQALTLRCDRNASWPLLVTTLALQRAPPLTLRRRPGCGRKHLYICTGGAQNAENTAPCLPTCLRHRMPHFCDQSRSIGEARSLGNQSVAPGTIFDMPLGPQRRLRNPDKPAQTNIASKDRGPSQDKVLHRAPTANTKRRSKPPWRELSCQAPNHTMVWNGLYVFAQIHAGGPVSRRRCFDAAGSPDPVKFVLRYKGAQQLWFRCCQTIGLCASYDKTRAEKLRATRRRDNIGQRGKIPI